MNLNMSLNDLRLNFQITNRMALVACIAAAGLVCITLAYSLWQWHSDWVLSHQNDAPLPVVAQIASPDETATIPGEHIFGKSLGKLGQMPVTNLQMRVTGIVKVTEQSGLISKAYISLSGNPSKIYQVGDNLPYGVKVIDITSDAVILENDSQLEKLPLPREKLKFKPGKTEELS